MKLFSTNSLAQHQRNLIMPTREVILFEIKYNGQNIKEMASCFFKKALWKLVKSLKIPQAFIFHALRISQYKTKSNINSGGTM